MTTAREIELDIERIKRELKEVRKCRKRQTKKAMEAAKETKSMIKECAKRRFPQDMRLVAKFTELASKM